MAKIAWFGAGLMGSGFVRAMCARGEEVAVYNRTFEKARALERFGARAHADARAAARGAIRVHLTLCDDTAVDALLAALKGALEPGAIVIDHSTVAPAATAARSERMSARGYAFLHAPVFMSPVHASRGAGSMLVGGPRATYAAVRSELERMTGRVLYVGEEPGKAAALKLVGNAVLSFIVTGLSDVFMLGQSAGVAPGEAFEFMSELAFGDAARSIGGKLARGDTSLSVTLATARKDLQLMLETAEQAETALHVLPSIAARMDALIAAGHGGDDVVVVGRDIHAGRAIRATDPAPS